MSDANEPTSRAQRDVDAIRAEMGEPTRKLGGRGSVDAPLYRRTDVSGRPFSNKGFMRVLGVLGLLVVAGIFVLAKFGDVRPSVASPKPTPTAGVLSAATPAPASDPQEETDAANERSRLGGDGLMTQTRATRIGYGNAIDQLNQTADGLNDNGEPNTQTTAAITSGNAMPAIATAANAPVAPVAPDGSNLGSAGTHVGESTGVVTTDVPPGSSGGAIAIGAGGVPIAMPTTPAQGRLADLAAAESAARTAGLRPDEGSTRVAVATTATGGPPMESLGGREEGVDAVTASARAQYVAQVAPSSSPAPFVRRSPSSAFLLRAGAHVPLVIDGPINSDSPVLQVAHIPSDVRDSIWHRYVLIPRDTEALLKVDSTGLGAQRVTVRITRLNFPDGTYMDLTPQAGTGADGEGGFGGQVNDHRGRIFTAALVTAGLSAIPIVAAGGSGSALTGQTAGQVVAGQVATQISSAGSQVIQARVNQPPTIFVPAGRIEGMVLDQDVPFVAPYAPNYPSATAGAQ